jgi:hypothetical protein
MMMMMIKMKMADRRLDKLIFFKTYNELV